MSPNGGNERKSLCSCLVGGGGGFLDDEGGNNDSFSDLAEQSDLESHLQLCFTSLSEATPPSPPPHDEGDETRSSWQ